MKNRKIFKMLCAIAMTLSMTVCGGGNVLAEEASIDREAEAEKLLENVKGTYEPLWDVLLSEEYAQNWLDACVPLVGEEGAEDAVKMLQDSVTGTVYGEEAVKAYADSDSAAFYCGFTQDVEYVTFDGDTISGTDEEEKELFSHSYHYAGYDEETGFYEYATDDEDAGEFTYFVLRDDTPETTAHIEFRYGSDLDDLVLYDSGDYAYWMASGILTGDNQEMAEKSIEIFCEENLQGE